MTLSVSFRLFGVYRTKVGACCSKRFRSSRCSKLDPTQVLRGKVAIVTGASSGIGEAIARRLAGAGASVALGARRLERLTKLTSEIEEKGGKALAVQTDVLKREEVQKLVSETESRLGPVDILVNNAGVMYYTMMTNLHMEEWEHMIDVNCKGMMHGVGAVLDTMVTRGSGHIVNISSDAGKRGFPGLAVYSGTKFFVEGMSQGLREEISHTGVRVTCVQPGDVETELSFRNSDREAQEKYDLSERMRVLEADDVGRAVLYAVSQPPHVAVNEIMVQPAVFPQS